MKKLLYDYFSYGRLNGKQLYLTVDLIAMFILFFAMMAFITYHPWLFTILAIVSFVLMWMSATIQVEFDEWLHDRTY